jgi:alginate O-acetyltransferase complex protein AlgJ
MILATMAMVLAWGAFEPVEPEAVRDKLRQLVNSAERNKTFVLRGADGRLFLTADVRSAVVGPFWQEHARAVSRARRAEHADPLECLVDVHNQLRGRGIDLLVVPVPSKAAAVPGSLVPAAVGLAENERIDADLAAFVKLLAERGISAIDLLPALRDANGSAAEAYCHADSHWSGMGIERAAEAIAKAVGEPDWLKAAPRRKFERSERDVRITGDLATLSRPGDAAQETVRLWFVAERATGNAPAPDPASPVLLLGDSHLLVFHDASLHAAGAGLPDQLAYRWGFAVDLVAVRGSASTAARVSVARNKERLLGKKLVIWCFASREFTESTDGWRKLAF